MSLAEDIRALADCPRCWALIDDHCNTPTGRSHTERVDVAIREALAQEGESRGIQFTDRHKLTFKRS